MLTHCSDVASIAGKRLRRKHGSQFFTIKQSKNGRISFLNCRVMLGLQRNAQQGMSMNGNIPGEVAQAES